MLKDKLSAFIVKVKNHARKLKNEVLALYLY